jgi:hypothetical protein
MCIDNISYFHELTKTCPLTIACSDHSNVVDRASMAGKKNASSTLEAPCVEAGHE